MEFEQKKKSVKKIVVVSLMEGKWKKAPKRIRILSVEVWKY